MTMPAHRLHGFHIRIRIRRCHGHDIGCDHCQQPTSESHFLFAASERPASLASTALGMPSTNWLTVCTNFPFEKVISRNFSLCMGFPDSSFIWATIFFVFTSTTSPEESKAYCPWIPIVIQSAEAVVGKVVLRTSQP